MMLPIGLIIERLQKALSEGNRKQVNATATILIRRNADLGSSWQTIANVLSTNGEHRLAVEAGNLALRSSQRDPKAIYQQAILLARAGAVAEARRLLIAVPDNVPSPGAYAYTRGTFALNLGDLDEARHYLLVATSSDPLSGQAWLALAMVARKGDRDILMLLEQSRSAMARASKRERAQYLYGLGKLLCDAGDHDAAFAVIAAASADWRSQINPDRSADSRSAESAVEGYTRASFDGDRRSSSDTSRPILVTGSPRAGTTLIEQILASHTSVAGGGELEIFRRLFNEIGGSSVPPSLQLSEKDIRLGLAEQYLHLLAQRFGEHGRVVDKSLDASRYLGAFATCLPDAPLIWITRNSLDQAWSCFKHFFLRGANWSYDLADIAHHFRLEESLLQKWQDLLGSRLLHVQYERLVHDPEAEIRKILAHCHLDVEPGVFSPHLTRRAVTTASAVQVRQPISASSVGSSAPYRQHLSPFVSAYD
ncbi:sulfotransferase [Microvirga sp. SRT01]|uniref:Sulfotransferase n=1 Tax=Sphingomonas longa TaxID=2778730 RepID=A0ABS2DCJ7_9SPHN|nr:MULTISPECIES: sulfotransferase [Alphaproteobacteria]MBM6577799.1 sulfotransferase [Sphingomonas sp. BT552]MBR7710841.1 sulfotransferase [Microvirga sp. SRT01]